MSILYIKGGKKVSIEVGNKYVIFKLDNEYYGLNIKNVQAIERFQSYTRVPNSPKYIKGVINLRGEVVPIMDLRTKLKLKTKEIDNNTRIIVAKHDEIVIGLIVDTSSEVLEIDNDHIDRPPSNGGDESQNYFEGIGKVNNRLIIIINLEKLLD